MADDIRVVRGVPTDEELAAVVGVLLARAAAAPGPADDLPLSHWQRSARPQAGPRPGPGAWRASALPR